MEHSLSVELRRTQSPSSLAFLIPEKTEEEIETLKKELHDKDSTITDLKNQLRSLQTIVEQLTRENSVLKTNSVEDDQSVTSQVSLDGPSLLPERGRSLETEQVMREDEGEVKPPKGPQRPVSMYETREGPKNNWQVTKHQVLTNLLLIRLTCHRCVALSVTFYTSAV